MFPPDSDAPPLPSRALGRVHLMGIGGAGMSGIARILLARGMSVSGCDARESPVLAELRAAGAAVSVGHDPQHARITDTLVVSSAVRAGHPELLEVRARGATVVPRAAALASVLADRRSIAVTGTHGKTTTTSMLATALGYCGADPSYLVGGAPAGGSPAAYEGTGEIFVAEADESDGSFLRLQPHAAVVTNVEADHLDNYGTAQAVHDAFRRFQGRIDPDGFLACCADDPGARGLAEAARGRGLQVCTYGESPSADLRVEGLELRELDCAFELARQGPPGRSRLGRVRLPVPGRHNAGNAAAALAAGMRLGFGFGELRDGLTTFTGVRRRFEPVARAGGVRVFDSYAHHPTELAADLRTARALAGRGRVLAAFQPHLYSRTRFFAAEFGAALGLADEAVVLDVYAAREDPEPGVTGALVADAVPLPAPRVRFEDSFAAVSSLLADRAGPGDVVLILGAGDITLLASRLAAALEPGGPARYPDPAAPGEAAPE